METQLRKLLMVRIAPGASQLMYDMVQISSPIYLACQWVTMTARPSAISPTVFVSALRNTVCLVSIPDGQFACTAIEALSDECFKSESSRIILP